MSATLCVDPVVLGPAREGDEETGERERGKKQEGEKKVQETGGREWGRWNARGCGWVCVCVHVWMKARISTSRK
jgi:hypothetical protein